MYVTLQKKLYSMWVIGYQMTQFKPCPPPQLFAADSDIHTNCKIFLYF